MHGALCIAYSGQCLTSEAIGGRSANRGACAQACRLPYELVVDGVLRELGDRAYLLSPEDLEASALVPDLAELGVASLKIEGRLKGPEYVAATTRALPPRGRRGGRSRRLPERGRARTALQMFSRGSGPGFLAGVDHQRLVDGRTCDHRGLLAGDHSARGAPGGKRRRGQGQRRHRARRRAPGRGGLRRRGESAGGSGASSWRGTTSSGRRPARKRSCGSARTSGSRRRSRPGAGLEDERPGARARSAHRSIARGAEAGCARLRISGALGEPRCSRGDARGGDSACHARRAARGRPLRPHERERPAREARPPRRHAVRARRAPRRSPRERDAPALVPQPRAARARRRAPRRYASPPHPVTSATAADLLAAARPPDRAPPAAGLFVLCRTLEQASAALDAGADGVYLDFLELTGTGARRPRPARPPGPGPRHAGAAAHPQAGRGEDRSLPRVARARRAPRPRPGRSSYAQPGRDRADRGSDLPSGSGASATSRST